MGGAQEQSSQFLLPLSPTTTIHATGPIYLVNADSLSEQFAQQLFRLQRRPGSSKWSIRALQAILLLGLLTAAFLSFFDPQLRGGLAQALRLSSGGGAPPPARDLDFPVQACCIGEQCVRNSKGRHAVVTHVHSQREVTQLQQLEASVRRTNPSIDVAVMLLRGQLSQAATDRILNMNVTVFYVEPLPRQLAGTDARSSAAQSWLKLRAFGLTQYDAVLLVDSNAYVAGDVMPLFSLPTDFAAGWDQARWLGGNDTVARAISGGATFLRPCASTETHMLNMLVRREATPALKKASLPARVAAAQGGGGSSAEQEFLSWYFQYAGASLPFDVYVINMDGASERLASFQQTFQESDLKAKNFVRFPAVNGSALDAQRLVSPKAAQEIAQAETAGYRTKHYQLTHGSLGCYMSHLQLYQHILKSDAQFAMVFEDDAVFAERGLLAALVEAKPFPDDWDIVLLGYYHCQGCVAVPYAPQYRLARFWHGTHAYIIHRRGLQKIFSYPRLMPIEKQIDAVMADMCMEGYLNVYALADPLVEQDSKRFKSTIQVPVKRKLGVNPYARE